MKVQYIADDLKDQFVEHKLFDAISALEGDVFREVAGRRTIRTVIAGNAYFVKIHHGVGWAEILKNLLQFRLPVLGARNEYEALNRLKAAGVPTMEVALYCEEGSNPATRRSAIVTRSLENTESLEYYQPETPGFKWRLIREIADMSRKMHATGVNHRDFYLCHFLMRNDRAVPLLYLIDLHRAQLRSEVPTRWLVKDIGGLLFSAFGVRLTRRDLFRFVRHYSGMPLRQALNDRAGFWKKVVTRAKRLYLQDHEQLPATVERLLG